MGLPEFRGPSLQWVVEVVQEIEPHAQQVASLCDLALSSLGGRANPHTATIVDGC